MNCLDTDRRLLMMTNKELLSCLSQKTTSGGHIMKKMLKQIPPVYSRFAINVE